MDPMQNPQVQAMLQQLVAGNTALDQNQGTQQAQQPAMGVPIDPNAAAQAAGMLGQQAPAMPAPPPAIY